MNYTHNENIVKKLDYFYDTNKIPNIIVHGSPGSGKKTIIYSFLDKIYNGDKHKMKSNVMIVNCAHGKGIKFIREELKFFAKTNIQSNSGVMFKSIVLLNADFLTIDAQSALRRCIELFSHTTRFFIVVENKNKLLNPILSRFCSIFVPECIIDGKTVNLHKHILSQKYPLEELLNKREEIIMRKLDETFQKSPNSQILSELASEFYERGFSCMDVIGWLEKTELVCESKKTNVSMVYHKIRREYRCEKLLMFYIFMEIKQENN